MTTNCCDIQKDTHTDVQTYLIPGVNIFSNEMTECRSIDFTNVTKR